MMKLFNNIHKFNLYSLRFIKGAILHNEDGLMYADTEPKKYPKIKDILQLLRTPKRYNLEQIRNVQSEIELNNIKADRFEKLPLRCHGCGSFFHSDSFLNHGYISEDIFNRIIKGIVPVDTIRCKFCYDCNNHNISKPVFMRNSTYEKFLSFINIRPSLIIYVIDICDMYGSVIDNLFRIIGNKKRVIIVFNKIDLIPQDGNHLKAIEHVENVCRNFIKTNDELLGLKVKAIVLLSCKNLVGFNELVEAVRENYMGGQDIVIMGGCNSGKSTIFNLFQTLISNSHFEKNLSLSTISSYPGTTSNLVRFPITNDIIDSLSTVLSDEPLEIENETHFTVDRRIFDDLKVDSFSGIENIRNANDERMINVNKIAIYHLSSIPYTMAPELKTQRWLYDTPSTLSKNQIWNMMTTKEMKTALISCPIHPRTYKVPQGYSVCIANLCRIEVLSVENIESYHDMSKDQRTSKIIISVFCEHQIPQFTCPAPSAPSRTEILATQGKLKVPENLKNYQWNDFTSKDITIYGVNIKRCASDICIPSIGWIGIAASKNSKVNLRVWTREQNINILTPSLVPQLIMYKGKSGIQEFGRFSPHTYKFIRTIQPLTKMFEQTRVVRKMNEIFDHIEDKLDAEKVEKKKIQKELLKIEENKKMIDYKKKKQIKQDYKILE